MVHDRERLPGTTSRQQILQFMTTEHYALQAAKSAIVSETNGRAAIYLSSVSSGVVALAFVGQVSALGDAFFVFALALFLPLFFLGITTFVRLDQTSTESMLHARRINRLRHYYVELAPEMAPYFNHRTHDDMNDFLDEMAIFVPKKPGRWWGLWQQFLTIAGAVAVVNSVIAAAVAGVTVHVIAGLSLWPTIAIGAAIFIVAIWLHSRYLEKQYEETERRLETMFPGNGPL